MSENTNYWTAITANDATYDGLFYYAVKTTGIFCRPSCKSRIPRRENVTFFYTVQQAIDAHYKPCKRCRPDLMYYQPVTDIAQRIKQAIDCHYNEREALAENFMNIGVTQHRMAEIFRECYHITPNEYADKLRISAALELLADNQLSTIEVAMQTGFESVSAFYAFFRKHTQMSPGEYRKRLRMSPESAHKAYNTYETMLGNVGIGSDGSAVTAVQFEAISPWDGKRTADALTDEAARQIDAYCAGNLRQFDLPLRPMGTAFRQCVWTGLQSIPYGETRSYGQVAQLIGKPGASRAVGNANNANPILIVIPCHRVVGSDGALVGYAGGLDIKRKLLALERNAIYSYKTDTY